MLWGRPHALTAGELLGAGSARGATAGPRLSEDDLAAALGGRVPARGVVAKCCNGDEGAPRAGLPGREVTGQLASKGGPMGAQLNHTIVRVADKRAAATFLAEILGLDEPISFGPFVCVETANGVSLDYDDRGEPVRAHYAFLVSEAEFDDIFARVKERGLTYWADPGHQRPMVINGNGRGFYFEDPAGNNLEVLTRAYGT